MGECIDNLLLTLSDATEIELEWSVFEINSEDAVWIYELRDLESGVYTLRFGSLSATFEVTDDEESLADTVLIQYAMSDNRQRRDIYSNIAGGIRYFDFRLPGGFQDKDWSFGVEGEQFETDRSDPVDLSSREFVTKILTLGGCDGLSQWVAEKVNAIFACDLTFVDGIRYSLAGEMDNIASDVDEKRFVYLLPLREAPYMDVEFEAFIRLYLRRTPSHYRTAKDNHLRAYKK